MLINIHKITVNNMKTNRFTIVLALFLILGLNSCGWLYKEKIEPVSELSVTPIFVFNGGQTMVHTIGSPWVEPGVLVSEVKEGDNDLSPTLVIDNSELNVNVKDLYTIKYTATNRYGLSKTVNRYVLVTEDVSDLYDIKGTYYQGFSPGTNNLMSISQNEVKGFWDVTNIRDLSQPVVGYMADLGDFTYKVALTQFKRKASNLRYTYLTGTAEFFESSTPKRIIFTLTEVYDDGEPLASPKTYIWNLVE
jgi:hypothetical protein